MGAEQSVGDRYKTSPGVSNIRARYEMGPTPTNMHLFNPSAGIVKPPKQQPQPHHQPTAGSFAPSVFATHQRLPTYNHMHRPGNSPTETERSDSDIASMAGSEANSSGSPTGCGIDVMDRPDLIRSSSSKSAVEEAAEVGRGMVKRSDGERSAARAAFMEHLKAMQVAAEKNGTKVDPNRPAKQWKKWEAVETGKDVYKMGRYDVVRTQLLGSSIVKADVCSSVSFYRGIDEELAVQDPTISGEHEVETSC